MRNFLDRRAVICSTFFKYLSNIKNINVFEHVTKIPSDKLPALVLADGECDFNYDDDPVFASLIFTVAIAVQEGKNSISVVRSRMEDVLACLSLNYDAICAESGIIDFSFLKSDVDMSMMNKVFAGGYIFLGIKYKII